MASSQISEINGLFAAIMVEESTLCTRWNGGGLCVGENAFLAEKSHKTANLEKWIQFASSRNSVWRAAKSYILQFGSVKLESDFWFRESRESGIYEAV